MKSIKFSELKVGDYAKVVSKNCVGDESDNPMEIGDIIRRTTQFQCIEHGLWQGCLVLNDSNFTGSAAIVFLEECLFDIISYDDIINTPIAWDDE